MQTLETNKSDHQTRASQQCGVVQQRVARPPDPPEDCNLVAVHDGRGESATWLLTVEKDGEMVAILAWPKDWPSRVNGAFLRKRGFTTVVA